MDGAPSRPSATLGAAVLGLVAVALAAAGTVWALAAADGVTRLSAVNFEVEFIDGSIYLASGAAATCAAAATAWFERRWGMAALVAVVAVLTWGAFSTVRRYRSSRWADGLEVFIFVLPVASGLIGLLMIAFVVVLQPGDRRPTGVPAASASPARRR